MLNTNYGKQPPLVPHSARLKVDERYLATGSVLRSFDEANVGHACEMLAGIQPEVMVVCLLHF